MVLRCRLPPFVMAAGEGDPLFVRQLFGEVTSFVILPYPGTSASMAMLGAVSGGEHIKMGWKPKVSCRARRHDLPGQVTHRG